MNVLGSLDVDRATGGRFQFSKAQPFSLIDSTTGLPLCTTEFNRATRDSSRVQNVDLITLSASDPCSVQFKTNW